MDARVEDEPGLRLLPIPIDLDVVDRPDPTALVEVLVQDVEAAVALDPERVCGEVVRPEREPGDRRVAGRVEERVDRGVGDADVPVVMGDEATGRPASRRAPASASRAGRGREGAIPSGRVASSSPPAGAGSGRAVASRVSGAPAIRSAAAAATQPMGVSRTRWSWAGAHHDPGSSQPSRRMSPPGSLTRAARITVRPCA